MIANYDINTLQTHRKEKDIQGSNRKENGARSITEAISRLIGPNLPLIMSRLPDRSLSFADG